MLRTEAVVENAAPPAGLPVITMIKPRGKNARAGNGRCIGTSLANGTFAGKDLEVATFRELARDVAKANGGRKIEFPQKRGDWAGANGRD